MEDFFGLSGRPFAAASRTDRYFPAASIETARATLVRAVERAEGPTLVVGPVGTGKSLLLRLVAEHFAPTLRVATLAAGRIHSRRTLWQALLYELGLPYRGMDDGELRLAVVGHLTGPQASQKQVLLLVDEAHTLSPRLLDELRTLTDLSVDGQPAVRLVLAGGPTLEEHFAHPKLESFSQRLAARCYLEPLSREETTAFIAAQVAACDSCAEALFDADAFEAVHRATDGVPRLVNQVCDHALVLAYTEGVTEISAALVEQAWADLQQLPTPWSVPAPANGRSSSGTVEFGRLDDEPFEPDGELPSVRFPTERIRRTGESHEAAFEQTTDFTEEVAAGVDADGFDNDVETFAVHSADDLIHDEDYVAGDAATQIELSVAETAEDPFGEPFAEEESVVDPVASLTATEPAKKVPAAPPRPIARPAAATPAPSKTDEIPAVAASNTVDSNPSANAPAVVAPPVARPAATAWPSGNPAAVDQPVIAPLPTLAVSAAQKACPDTAARTAAAARKPPKYSQLFSQLKRNSG